MVTVTSSDDWAFSEPGSADPVVAVEALTNAVALHPDAYAGVSVSNGGLRAVVHLVQGATASPDVSTFMATAMAAGVAVTSDEKQYSTSALATVLDRIDQSVALSASGVVLGSQIDIDRNKVLVTVDAITPELTAAVAQEFGDTVVLAPGRA